MIWRLLAWFLAFISPSYSEGFSQRRGVEPGRRAKSGRRFGG